MPRGVLLSCAVVAAGVLPSPPGWARQDAVDAGGVSTVFFVAKSENKNQVHYGIRLDARCAPVGDSPVYAYWRMLERGPSSFEPLLARERPAYGIAAQRVLERGPSTSRTRVLLQALPSHPMVIETYPVAGRCAARAVLALAGLPAVLGEVFVQLRWPFGVAYLLLAGHALESGAAVSERVQP